MGKKLAALALCAVLMSMTAGSAAGADDPTLVGWWEFNEGAGTTVGDSSSYGHEGVLVGDPQWVAGKIGSGALSFDGSDGLVQVPESPALDAGNALTLTAWVNLSNLSTYYFVATKAPSGTAASNYPGNYEFRIASATGILQLLHQTSQGQDFATYASTGSVTAGQWRHVAVTLQAGGRVEFYIDGTSAGGADQTTTFGILNDEPVRIGGRKDNYSYFNGLMDDVRIYSRVLTPQELSDVILGKGPSEELADDPTPKDEATDVLQDATLAWTAGAFAASHDVYFGTSFADVNDAVRNDPKGVLVSKDQADATYDPDGLLEFGRTYYWRVDEVNGAPDSTIFKGETWSFTTEPYAYAITGTITATASAFQSNMKPESTVDGSGLDDLDQHSIDGTQMWMSGAKPAWIQFAFDKAYKLHEMWVWNSNQSVESFLGFGAKDVTVEYSTDGATWTTLEGVPQFARAPGTPTYQANTTVEFGDVMAKFVKLTITTNWGGLAAQTGLSEVRFFYVPVQAFAPQPAAGATGVSVETDLLWRPGREAKSHTVYIGADSNAVAGSLVSGNSVTAYRFAPVDLLFATQYFWKVDEVGDAGVRPGDVWSFTTEDYASVDDFESYTDDMEAEETIWQTWIDGMTDSKSGSQVGHDSAPFAETTVVHGGKQSMILAYDNSDFSFSEATRTFDAPQNWAVRGIKTLSLRFAGLAGNDGQLYLKINGAKIAYHGDPADLTRTVWQAWNVDLSTVGGVNNVRSLTLGVEGAGAAGTLYVDDIRLYSLPGATMPPTDPGTTGLVAWYKFDGDAKDSAGTHHATLTGSPTYVAGKAGQALNMPLDMQYAGVDYAADLAMNTFTVAAWVNVADADSSRGVIGTRIGGENTFDLKVEAARIHGDIGDGSAWLNTSLDITAARGGAISLNEWHHIAYVVDDAADTVTMYLDGVPAATAAFTGTPLFMKSGQTLGIGRDYDGAAEFMHGTIDEVRIYNRTLSAAEVAWMAGRRTPVDQPL
ncbi:MAG: LamG-like jellyroll fold domain-containing protein [Phycisphaerales bacterium]